MKKIKLTLPFITITALFYSCTKDDFNEDPITDENVLPIPVRQSKNPYNIYNMKIAYRYLIRQGRLDSKMFRDFKVRATHNYVKLTPATLEEEDLIAADTTFVALDYPLDVDLPESYFENRKELEEGVIPEYYSSLKLNQKIAYNGSIEQIEEMYIPEEYPYFENADEDYRAGSKTITTRAQLHDELLFTAYFLQGLEYLINEDEFAAKGINLEDNKPEKPSITNKDNTIVIDDASQKRFNDNIIKPLFFGKRWNPSGNIKYTDNSFPDGQQIRPLPGAQILIRQGVTVHTAITDNNGNFRTGRVRGPVRYLIQWERHLYNIKGTTGWQAEMRGPRYNRRAWNKTIELNGGSYEYDSQKDIYHSLIHVACLDYYYGDRFGLTQPRSNIRIKAKATNSCTSSHVTLRKNFLGSDIHLCEFRNNHSKIYGTTIHELAHSAHYQFNRPGYNKLVRDGHINPWISLAGQTHRAPGPTAKSARRTLETWATTVELLFVQRRYGLLVDSDNGIRVHERYRELMQNFTSLEEIYYTSCGFDLIDNHNQSTNFINRPLDRVSGYTPRQLEMSLYGATNWNKWRDNIKSQHTNNTSQFVDELFANWN